MDKTHHPSFLITSSAIFVYFGLAPGQERGLIRINACKCRLFTSGEVDMVPTTDTVPGGMLLKSPILTPIPATSPNTAQFLTHPHPTRQGHQQHVTPPTSPLITTSPKSQPHPPNPTPPPNRHNVNPLPPQPQRPPPRRPQYPSPSPPSPSSSH